MSRLWAMPPGRLVVLTGAVVFAAFLLVAVVLGQAGVGQQRLSLIGGLLAYGYIAFAAAVAVRAWRARPSRAQRAVHRYLSEHPAVVTWFGTPLRLDMPNQPDPGGPGQANVTVGVAGPLGEASAEVVLARLNRDWEVLRAVLVMDGERVPLAPVRR